jgi:hypothetical protein
VRIANNRENYIASLGHRAFPRVVDRQRAKILRPWLTCKAPLRAIDVGAEQRSPIRPAIVAHPPSMIAPWNMQPHVAIA